MSEFNQTRRLTILEGPDGGGKTTLALQLMHGGYHYAHLGPFHRVNRNLGRLYIEAMMPALLGHRNVVMDRSWLSESIYAEVFREGKSRLPDWGRRMLDRVAMRCDVTVVACLPSVDACVSAFQARQGEEYLDRESQLRAVYGLYQQRVADESLTDLPTIVYNYAHSKKPNIDALGMLIDPHRVSSKTAGNVLAPVALIGEGFGPHKDEDALLQFPFVSFSKQGCSAWLTEQLAEAGVTERDLMWGNIDDPTLKDELQRYPGLVPRRIFVLGKVAARKILDLGLSAAHEVTMMPHPQYAKRFHHRKPYELIDKVKQALIDLKEERL